MNVLRELWDEISSMFAGDAVLTLGALATVALAAVLRYLAPVPPIAAGAVLFAGPVLVLALRVLAAARK